MLSRNIFLGIRLILGVLFIISGMEKAISPSENFLYVIQSYDVLPDLLERLSSVLFPWVELIIGMFLLLGLWLRPALWVLGGVSVSLILMVSQAIIRKLPLDSCGCFGSLIHLPLSGVIVLDMTILCCVILCLRHIDLTEYCSLDKFLAKPGR